MTINKIQNHSFTGKLRKADNRMNIDSTKGPQVVKQGIRIEANSIREAQKSKDGLSYMPQNQYNINDVSNCNLLPTSVVFKSNIS